MHVYLLSHLAGPCHFILHDIKLLKVKSRSRTECKGLKMTLSKYDIEMNSDKDTVRKMLTMMESLHGGLKSYDKSYSSDNGPCPI